MRRWLRTLWRDRGFAIVVILVLIGVIMAFTLGLTGYIYSTKKIKYYVQDENAAINLAETGLSKALFCLNSDYDAGCGGTYGDAYVGEIKVVSGQGEYQTTVTGIGPERFIESTGTLLNGSSRTVTVTVTSGPPTDPALAPEYAVQVGAAGIRIEDLAQINGPLYAGGEVRCDSLYNDINGPVSTSAVNGLIYRCDIAGDTRADRIWRCDVTGDAYYYTPITGIANTTVSGIKHPYSTRPEVKPLPVPDIDFWESSAEFGGIIEGNHVATTGYLGPIHITGNLTVPSGVTVTILGPIWVDGAVNVEDGGVLQLDPSFDRYGSVILIGDYDNPQPGNQIIVDCEQLTTGEDINIVGDVGVILDLEEGSWTSEGSPTGETLWGLDLRTSVDGWAVGNGGKIVHWDGTSWSNVTSPTFALLGDVSVITSTDGWAVGAGGIILRWDGLSWSVLSSPTWNSLYGVDAFTATDAWAVGSFGTIIHRGLVGWSAVASPTTNLLRGVAALSATDAWAVGANGTIIRWNGTSWLTVASPTSNELYEVSAVSADAAWAVGANSTIIRWNGTSWSTVASPVTADFRDVVMLDTDDVHIVGTAGTILHWNGSSLTQQTSPVSGDLQAVSGLGGQCANPPNIYGSGHGDSYLMVISNGSGTGVDTAAVYLHTGVTSGIFLATHGRVSHIGASSVTHLSGEYVYMRSSATVNYDAGLATAEFANSPPGTWRRKAGTWAEKSE